MVSASKHAVAQPPVSGTAATAPARPIAHLNARISAYLIDSVVLLAFILVFFVASGSILVLTSDMGRGDAPDEAYHAFVWLLLGGLLLAWSAFNMVLLHVRGQTTGMYVLHIKAESLDSDRFSPRQTLVRWFGLHPLLFHPLLLLIWAFAAYYFVSLTLSQIALIVTVALMLLCVIAPVAALAAALTDAERRGLHDRLARAVVVHIHEP